MEQNKNIIIGAGITGLVWRFYNPEFHIISPEEPGGTYGKNYLVWLHDTFETRKLISDLGWKNPEKLSKKSYIGYYYNGWISDQLIRDMNLVLIQKKMTPWNEPIDKDFVPKTSELSMSTENSGNYMNCLDVDLSEMVRRLSKEADIENGFVVGITDKTIRVKKSFSPDDTDTVREYENLVSTMNAPLFWKAYGQEKEFKGFPITNIVTNVRPKMMDDRYEMVYYDDTQPFTRISHMGDRYAIEITGHMLKIDFQKMFPDLPVLEYFVVKNGRIFENVENSPPNPNIIFSGRFAQWKYGITSEWVIKQALDYKEQKHV